MAAHAEPVVPHELLLAILDELPCKPLLCMRAVNHEFRRSIDHCILRARLLAIVTDRVTQLVFGSATPAQYRNAVCQVLAFSRFDASPAGNLTAHFTIAPLEIQTVHLDSDVLFGNLMLSVRIQGKDDDEEADTDAPVLASSPTGSTSSSSSSRSTFPFTLSLVEGLDRVYRSWFVDPQSPLPTYAGMTMRTAPQVLYPSAVCALLKANIQCLLTPKSAPSATPLFRSELDEEPPIDLHFYYESVELDVGRLVASAEKGLSSGFPRGEMTLYVRRT